MQQHAPNPSALLIIDMQVGLFNGPERPWRAEQLLDNINTLIAKHARPTSPFLPCATPGHKTPPSQQAAHSGNCTPI